MTKKEILFSKKFKDELKSTLTKQNDHVRALLLISPTLLASAAGKEINIYNWTSGEVTQRLLDSSSAVTCLAMIDNTFLVSGCHDKKILIWDIKSGQCKRTLQGHTAQVKCLTILPNGCIASGSDDGTVRLWDSNTGNLINTLTGHQGEVTALCTLTKKSLLNNETIKI